MSLETAIRKALERVGPGADPEQRARVYQSARMALENGMRQQNITDAATAAEQRRQLEAAINRVERDAKLDYMEHEARNRAAREAAEREERRKRELEMAEQARLEAEQARERSERAREQAERDAEMRRRRDEIDRERIAREMEYEAAQRALRERIAAREQAARERALAEREQLLAAERQEEDARREAEEARRHAADQAEREAEARRRALEEQAEREEAVRAQAERERLAREQAAREFAEKQAAERERLAREEAERQAAEREARERLVREEAERRAAEETARRAEEADLSRRAEAAAAGTRRAPEAEAETRALAAMDGVIRRETVVQGVASSVNDAPAVELDRAGTQRDPVFDIMPEVEERGERRAPSFDIEVPQPHHAAAEEAEPQPEVIHLPPERAIKPRRKSRWKARAFALVTFAAFGAAGWWWVESTGLTLPKAVRDGSVPNPPPTAKAEDFDGAKQLKSLSRQGGFGEEWTKLFEAGKSKSFSVGTQASAKVEQSGSGPYLAITSAAAGIDGSISIELPQSVIASMQGKTSNIALMLEGGEKPVQVTVECEFGGLGNCGRHRFLLSQNKTDLMFDVAVKGGNPEGAGRLVINAGAGGEGNTAKLFSIHVLPGG